MPSAPPAAPKLAAKVQVTGLLRLTVAVFQQAPLWPLVAAVSVQETPSITALPTGFQLGHDCIWACKTEAPQDKTRKEKMKIRKNKREKCLRLIDAAGAALGGEIN